MATTTITNANKKNTYDPKSGVGYDENGVQYQKYTWEDVPDQPGMLQRENAGTGDVIGKSISDYSNPTTESTTTQSPTMEDYMNQLKDAQRKSAIAGLDAAKNNALAGLANEESGLEPQYYEKRRQATANSDVSALNFAKYMAGRGVKGNAGAMPEVYRNVALQNQIGGLNSQEQSARDTIARNRSNIESNYQSDVAAANANIDAQGLQNYINQMNADRAYALQESGVTGTLNGTKTLAAQSQEFNQNIATRQQTAAEKQQTLDNLYRQQTFDYQKSRDSVADAQWQASINLDLRQQSFSEAQQKIENALAQRRISQEDASQALQWAKFNADNDPNSLDNQLKLNNSGMKAVKNADGTYSYVKDTNSISQDSYNNYVNMGRDMLDKGNYDSESGSYKKMYTPQQVKDWVLGLPISNDVAAKLMSDLGV